MARRMVVSSEIPIAARLSANKESRARWPQLALLVLCSGLFMSCGPTGRVARPEPRAAAIARVVPQPVSITPAADAFVLTDSVSITIGSGDPQVFRIAEQLASLLRPSTGFVIPISSTGASVRGAIILRLSADTAHGREGYELAVWRDSVRVTTRQLYVILKCPSLRIPTSNKSCARVSPRSKS